VFVLLFHVAPTRRRACLCSIVGVPVWLSGHKGEPVYVVLLVYLSGCSDTKASMSMEYCWCTVYLSGCPDTKASMSMEYCWCTVYLSGCLSPRE
jgi:hypothetical protein